MRPLRALLAVFCLSFIPLVYAAAPSIERSSGPADTGLPVAEDDKVWVIIKPLQCLDNPWEQDWLKKHSKKHPYPHHDERRIIKDYFGSRGVAIWDMRSKRHEAGNALCRTCGCERGDSLFLLINASAGPRMKAFGYTRIVPDKDSLRNPS